MHFNRKRWQGWRVWSGGMMNYEEMMEPEEAGSPRKRYVREFP